jgi:hypothetical protein
MRFMLSVRIPSEKANALIKEGKFPQTVQSIMEELQPEAAYWTDMDGVRSLHAPPALRHRHRRT